MFEITIRNTETGETASFATKFYVCIARTQDGVACSMQGSASRDDLVTILDSMDGARDNLLDERPEVKLLYEAHKLFGSRTYSDLSSMGLGALECLAGMEGERDEQ